MTCEPMKLPGGGTAIVCSRGQRPRRCACGAVATRLCDYPKGRGTCDKPICADCAKPVGPNRDHCPEHAGRQQGEMKI